MWTCCSLRWSWPRSIAPPRSWSRTLGGFLVVLSAVLFVMLAVACCRGVLRCGGLLAVALLHGSLVLAVLAFGGISMFVLVSSPELFACSIRVSRALLILYAALDSMVMCAAKKALSKSGHF